MNPRSRHPASVLIRVVAAIALAAGLLGSGAASGGPAAVRGASPDLTLVTAATYLVQPAAQKVSISVAITATNHLSDTATKRSYFSSGYLAVLPMTAGFKVSGPGGPSVSVARRTSTYTLLRLNFGSKLGSGPSRKLSLTFDLHDPGGAPDRPIRISPSLVSFYAWAYATPSTPGSSVTVTFPAGYNVSIGRGPLRGPVANADGSQSWASGSLAAPLAFVADVTADHPADYVDVDRTAAIGSQQADLVIRSWPDDAAWRKRVGDLVVQSLPVLSQSIGLPWPEAENPLIVQEALVRSTGGYAGLFDPAQHRVEIAYAAEPGVILHEAAHAWFNGRLVADRWAAEAFASYYAALAGQTLKVALSSPVLDATTRAAAFPLNAWGPVGSEPPAEEAYAYAASLALARAIADRAGPSGLQRVWALADAGTGAYQPASGPPEPAAGPPDWRGLLDLLDDATGKSYDDLWRTWVARPEDRAALDARAAARAAYATAVGDAGSWLLPRSIRDAMRAWQFDVAERELSDAESVLRQRSALEAAAATARLQLPPTLRTAFESGDLSGAAGEAAAELATVGAIDDAASAEPATADLLDTIGLLGAAPADELRAARTAFAAGQLDSAARAAAAAKTDWTTAGAVGRGRVISAIGLAVALVLLVMLLAGQRHRLARRFRRRSEPPDDPLHSRP